MSFQMEGNSAPNVICLSMSGYDSLQLVNAATPMRQLLRKAVRSVYSPGISHSCVMGKDYELVLNGYPWQSADFGEGVMARKALLQAIRCFDAERFRLIGTVNLKGTADSLFFEQVVSSN